MLRRNGELPQAREKMLEEMGVDMGRAGEGDTRADGRSPSQELRGGAEPESSGETRAKNKRRSVVAAESEFR